MKIKTCIYTSYYAKMLKRHKVEGRDWYIQVSRSLFLPIQGVDKKTIAEQIDFNYGQVFGNFSSSLKQYEKDIKGEEYNEYFEELRDILKGKTLFNEYDDDDIAELEEVIDDLKKWKEKVKDLSVEKRIQMFNKEYPTKADKEDISFFGLTEDCLRGNFSKWEPAITYNLFILCYENLESKYTAKDEAKYSDVKAGEFKKCHRTIIAKVLNERFGLRISEYKEKEMQSELDFK